MVDRVKLLMHACITARVAAQRRAAGSDYWATVAAILGDESFHRALAGEITAGAEARQAVRTVVDRFSRRAKRRCTGAAAEIGFELKGAEGLLLALLEEQAALVRRWPSAIPSRAPSGSRDRDPSNR